MSEEKVESYVVDVYRNAKTGEVEREIWFDPETKLRHRTNGPADIKYYDFEGRACRSETFFRQGLRERPGDLPSQVVVDVETNEEILQRWYQAGEFSRHGGKPALLVKDFRSGVVWREEYWEDGQMHRENGPASIYRWKKTGEIESIDFFLRGVRQENPNEPSPR